MQPSPIVVRWLAASLLVIGASWLGAGDVRASGQPPQAMIESAVGEALDVLRTRRDELLADPALLRSEIDRIVVPHVDFEATTRLAVGRAWRTADTTQKKALVEQFENLLLNTYADALREYSGQSMSFEPFRPGDRDDRATVRSAFESGGGVPDVPVVYKLREKGGTWWIYDVEVDGLSLVTNYRNAFAAEIERGGVSGLIATLKAKASVDRG